MKITLARLQTALAIATANGNAADAEHFQLLIDQTTFMAKDPYIMPDVLTPPAPAVDVAAMTKDEVHDAVQAGVITRQDAVDAGVIAHVDELSPHPGEVTADSVTVPQPEPVEPAPDSPPPAPADNSGVDTSGPASPTSSPSPVTPPPADPVPDVVPVDTTPAVTPEVPQADSGDEDPTPAEKETIASLDARLDKVERPGKVSRQ